MPTLSPRRLLQKLVLLPGPLANAVAAIEATVGVPLPTALVISGAVLEGGAAVLIAMGLLIRPASNVLLIFAALGMFGLQWQVRNGMQSDQIISVLNEFSIMGALLVLSSQVGRLSAS
jgi:uncharacterized membrane protein YphA (DoxX/SURF4 family)